MKFEFGKYTDVTKYAKEVSADDFYNEYEGYEKILICPDTNDTWVAKIQVGWNKEFEQDPNKVIIERNRLEGAGAKHVDINKPNYCFDMLKLDIEDGFGWDVYEYDSVEEALEDLDAGYGIIKEEK